jgi:dTDP-4-amino-4,6-dideoxygalactose transaminase
VLAIDGGAPVRRDALDFSKGAALIGDEEAEAVAAVIAGRSLFRYKDDLTAGTVADFERAACELLGCRFAVAVANGTAALRTALAALGVGCGDEVIVPAFTFVATVNAVVSASAVPVFAEVDETLGIDPSDLEQQITDRTAAIIVVHLENVACDLDALLAVADRRNIPVIEDTAQSFGATYHGRALGTFGALGTFSLQQEKNITAGEGGLVVTDDETRYLRAARFQDQGGQFVTSYASARGDELTEPFAGENLRMGELAGAVAGVQLTRLPGILADRRARPAPPARPRRRRLVEHHLVPPRRRTREALRRGGAIRRDSLRADVPGASGVPERGRAGATHRVRSGRTVVVRRAPHRPHVRSGSLPAHRSARRPVGDRAGRRRLLGTRLHRCRDRGAQGRGHSPRMSKPGADPEARTVLRRRTCVGGPEVEAA